MATSKSITKSSTQRFGDRFLGSMTTRLSIDVTKDIRLFCSGEESIQATEPTNFVGLFDFRNFFYINPYSNRLTISIRQ